MRQSRTRKATLFAVMAICLMIAGVVTAQMMEPKMTTIKGSVVDMTCASKGHAMSGEWMNAKDDHMMPEEGMKSGCGTMCLKGSQPAGLFDGETISAVFACNPAATLSAYSGKQVEVQGFWAGDDSVKTFVPAKIREGSGDWTDVQCATMH
ncbi:MAG: hypothetical protein E2P02_07480 [Acidobacteria bacterium]|nr:MAG: hypothetical protein E2P02_07480 [Acidobacteriota bacterium]